MRYTVNFTICTNVPFICDHGDAVLRGGVVLFLSGTPCCVPLLLNNMIPLCVLRSGSAANRGVVVVVAVVAVMAGFVVLLLGWLIDGLVDRLIDFVAGLSDLFLLLCCW